MGIQPIALCCSVGTMLDLTASFLGVTAVSVASGSASCDAAGQ